MKKGSIEEDDVLARLRRQQREEALRRMAEEDGEGDADLDDSVGLTPEDDVINDDGFEDTPPFDAASDDDPMPPDLSDLDDADNGVDEDAVEAKVPDKEPKKKAKRSRNGGGSRNRSDDMAKESKEKDTRELPDKLQELKDSVEEVAIRLLRRDASSGQFETVGYWKSRPVQDVFEREEWVYEWSGGGAYTMNVFRQQELSKPFLTLNFKLAGDPLEPLNMRQERQKKEQQQQQQQQPMGMGMNQGMPGMGGMPGMQMGQPGFGQPFGAPQNPYSPYGGAYAAPGGDPWGRPYSPFSRPIRPASVEVERRRPSRDDDDDDDDKTTELLKQMMEQNRMFMEQQNQQRQYTEQQRYADQQRQWEEDRRRREEEERRRYEEERRADERRRDEERRMREEERRKEEERRADERKKWEADQKNKEDEHRRQIEEMRLQREADERRRIEEKAEADRQRLEAEQKRAEENFRRELQVEQERHVRELEERKREADQMRRELESRLNSIEDGRRRDIDEFKQKSEKQELAEAIRESQRAQAESHRQQFDMLMKTLDDRGKENKDAALLVEFLKSQRDTMNMTSNQQGDLMKLILAQSGKGGEMQEVYMKMLTDLVNPERTMGTYKAIGEMATSNAQFMTDLVKSGILSQLGLAPQEQQEGNPWVSVADRVVDAFGKVGEAVLTAKQAQAEQEESNRQALVKQQQYMAMRQEQARRQRAMQQAQQMQSGFGGGGGGVDLPEPHMFGMPQQQVQAQYGVPPMPQGYPGMPQGVPQGMPTERPATPRRQQVPQGMMEDESLGGVTEPPAQQPAKVDPLEKPMHDIRDAISRGDDPDEVAFMLFDYVSFMERWDLLPEEAKQIFQMPREAIPYIVEGLLQLEVDKEYIEQLANRFGEIVEEAAQEEADREKEGEEEEEVDAPDTGNGDGSVAADDAEEEESELDLDTEPPPAAVVKKPIQA